jgi:hypothetical protein
MLEDAWRRREELFDTVILYEELMMNHNVVSQKLQGVGFSKSEVEVTYFAVRHYFI